MAVVKESAILNTPLIDGSSTKNKLVVSEFEKSLILKIFKKCGFEKSELQDCEIESINSKFLYESYSIVFDKKKYLLKISLDPENESISNEYKALSKVSDVVSTSVINYEKDEEIDIEYILTSWEHGESFEVFGIEDFVYNIGTFSSVLDIIHETEVHDIDDFNTRFQKLTSIEDLKDEVDDRELLIFEELTGLTFQDISDIFCIIKNDYLPQYKEDVKVLCHSNLKLSNILYRDGNIKVINFENSFCCDIYYSLLKFVNNSGLYFNQKTIKQFLKKYYKFSILLPNLTEEQFISNYESKKKLNRIFLFQEVFSKIIFHFFTYGAFTRKDDLYQYLTLYLNLKSTVKEIFPDKISKLDRLFYTSFPNIKTYNKEKIKELIDSYEED